MNARERVVDGVTDHALLRYLETVAGLDLDVIREKIRMTALEAIRTGSSAYLTETGHTYIVENEVVVTILDRPKLESAGKIHKAHLRAATLLSRRYMNLDDHQLRPRSETRPCRRNRLLKHFREIRDEVSELQC